LQYDPANGSDKNNLIEYIKLLQTNVKNVLDQNENQILSHIAGIFNFSDQHAVILLREIILPGQAKTLSEILSGETLLDKIPSGDYKEISTANFTDHFSVYALLHKVSIILQRINFSPEDLEWFITHHATIGSLDFSALPIAPGVVDLYPNWKTLYQLMTFMSKYPEPENVSFRNILEMAMDHTVAVDDLLSELGKLVSWSQEELKKLHTGLNLKHENGKLDYLNHETYWRLHKCMEQIKLTGVDAATMFSWADRENETIQSSTALQSRLAIKSKYENEDWLQKIIPLMDNIRDKKRKALVAYHIEHSQRNQASEVTFNGDK